MKLQEEYSNKYYFYSQDFYKYDYCWLHIVYSRRGPGKTYSGLRHFLIRNEPIIYMKRTVDDVDLICSNNKYGFDASPYVPLNRDIDGLNIKGKLIRSGIGGFWHTNDEGEPTGLPVSYALALNAAKKYKGFDFSSCVAILLDEFIPQVGEIVKKKDGGEGSMLLDFYMTVNRDRQKRGLQPLKLILFANAENISCPIVSELDIMDDIADLNNSGEAYKILEDRGIMIHHILDSEVPITEEEQEGIFQGMKGTAWAAKSFGGVFSNNDFSNVDKMSLKKMQPYIHLTWKHHEWYIYLHPDQGIYYCTESPSKCLHEFNLNRENDQKRFFFDEYLDLRDACMNDRFKFKKYSMYDLFINYKNYFKV